MQATELRDAHGALTTSPETALSGIDDFVLGFVGYHPRATKVLAVAEAHPESALANLYAGFLWMFLERPEAVDQAAPWLERAKRVRGLNARERGLLALLSAWIGRDARASLAIADALCREYPEDLATLKLGQYHAFNLADPAAALRLAKHGRGCNEHSAPWHSMLAFGHELNGQLDAAERAAFRALDLDEAEPWAHHALSHTYLERGALEEGRRFLADRADTWNELNSFMFTHNWWHLALFELAEGDATAALRTFDDRVWGVQPDYSQDQINAVSLLSRLECAGVDVGDRWQRLRPHLEGRADDVLQPFVTMHYLYGLTRSGSPGADNLLALIESQVDGAFVPGNEALWANVGIPCARGAHAHARGDHEQAATLLLAVRERLPELGGSKAQRDLFEQWLVHALLKCSRLREARPLLAQRRKTEPDHPLIRFGDEGSCG